MSALQIQASLRRPRFLLQVDFTAPPGVTVLYGPSGCGKSTTLDLVAGHGRPDSGRVAGPGGLFFDAATGVDRPPHQRGLGYAMQAPALFPHLDVAGNLGYGLFALPRAARAARVAEVAESLGLLELLQARPAELSGGQAQRVALGRALAPRPAALLLDEPLSALDEAARHDLLRRLGEVFAAVPVLYVTHQGDEAAWLGRRIIRFQVQTERESQLVHAREA